jgi:hypothetical protein
MTKNLGRKYAAMSEDERRNFAQVEEEGTRELPAELELGETRKQEGPHYVNPREEIADPEHRDGMSSQLDDEGHQRGVQEWIRRSKSVDPDLDLGDQSQAGDSRE